MSRILILDNQQFEALKSVFKYAMRNAWMPQDGEITNLYDSIRRVFEDAEKENRSVLEWHPMSEKPETGLVVLVRTNENNVFTNISDDYKFWSKKTIIEWAYLTERGINNGKT